MSVDTPALAQQAERTARPSATGGTPAAVRAATEFLFAAYPELGGRALEIQVKPEGTEWLLSLAEGPGGAQSPSAASEPRPVLLRGRIAFDRQGRIAHYAADGPYLWDLHNATLREWVRTRPGSTEGDADAELIRLGGATTIGRTFVPGARAEDSRLATHLGAGVAASQARFVWREAAPGAPPEGAIRAAWVVDVTTEDGPYRFEYEPVGGRLIGVMRQGGAR